MKRWHLSIMFSFVLVLLVTGCFFSLMPIEFFSSSEATHELDCCSKIQPSVSPSPSDDFIQTATAFILYATRDAVYSDLGQTGLGQAALESNFENATAVAIQATELQEYVWTVTSNPTAALTPPPTRICIIGAGPGNYESYEDVLLTQAVLFQLEIAEIKVEDVRAVVIDDDRSCQGMKVVGISIIMVFPADTSYTNVERLAQITDDVITALYSLSIEAPQVALKLELPTIIDGELLEERVVWVDYLQATDLYQSGLRGSGLVAKVSDGIRVYPYGCVIAELGNDCPLVVPPTPFFWEEA